MSEPNWDYVAKLEKAIAEKYGKDALTNPKATWNQEKEDSYLEQIKELAQTRPQESELVDRDGVLVPSKLFMKENIRTCLSCKAYSFDRKDDLYMNKFKCCYKCYVYKVDTGKING